MYNNLIKPKFVNALKKIGIDESIQLCFETPSNPEHGDISTNIAMRLAKELKKQPRVIAQEIIDNLDFDTDLIESTSIAGAGFINIKFSKKFYTTALQSILSQNKNFGRTYLDHKKKVNIEYVSVNPTGLLHLGHGRNAAIGDTIANLYEWTGHEVTREYYFNNAGNQMQLLAISIYARYIQELGNNDYPFPDNGYHGDYIIDIAKEIINEYSDKLKENNPENLNTIKKFGENWCFKKISQTLERMNIKQDVFFNEDSLYKEGKIKELLELFEQKELSYQKDGATWLSFSKLGLSEDRVIVKSTGEPTYRLPDIAYHKEKFERGFDLMIDIFGADHIATVPDVMAAIKSIGYDTNKMKVIVYQFVTLTENGEQVKMSKRSGKVFTLDELLDEVGADVVRFFLVMRSYSSHLEFDLALAREQSDKNPVFYLQYAHARICSIFENLKKNSIQILSDIDYSLLIHQQEINLIKVLIDFPNIIKNSAEKCEPHSLAEYLRQVASNFHAFYHDCRIIGSENNLMQARIKLAEATMYVLNNGLNILGVSAPEKM